ncbi:MFS transporter [Sphingomonas sp. H39-1-10]|uniref:MFS transporter n=1 Tax=Sphingomonas pollutisoli TaxID=3030829 RepID=UPI0023B97733|nr:MFS transporter [Sphingomonas pollutisoli]MDF0490355.1 MFS transporter [Sphingomonas pollutisoli]
MQRPSLPLLATVAIFCCLEFLQTGMMAFAAAPIMGEIDASPEEYSLIGVFYACVAVIVIAKMQWAVERIGWRSYVLAAVALYIIGAAVCGISSDATTFGIGRIIMACGGGGFMAMSRVLISHIAPGPGRFTGIRVFAVALATGSASAPLLASVSVTSDHWQMMFWILGGLALVGAVLAASFLPNHVEPSDVRSQSNAGQILLLALGSFVFLYALQRSYYDFYNDDLIIIAFLILALAALLIFVRYEQREDRSLFRMRELGTTRYVTGVILFAFSYVLLGANNYVLPFFLQRGLGYSWPTLGLLRIPTIARRHSNLMPRSVPI